MTAKRVLISIDERLLDRIDQACTRLGISRSAYIAQLADRELVGGVGPGADPAARAALATIDDLLRGAAR
jgi:hypothetical protein